MKKKPSKCRECGIAEPGHAILCKTGNAKAKKKERTMKQVRADTKRAKYEFYLALALEEDKRMNAMLNEIQWFIGQVSRRITGGPK